jgi:hypothetical protein
LAARLQGHATPGSLVISETTRHQLGHLFDLHALGLQPLAGFTEPQRAWLVLGEGGTVSRFEALRSIATQLVGRDEELDLLRRRWEQAKTSEGRVVLISGEPGIGKLPRTSHARACAGFARRTIRPARFTPRSFNSKVPPVSRAMMTVRQSGLNYANCSMTQVPRSSS